MRKQVRAPRRNGSAGSKRARGIEALNGFDLLCWIAAWSPPTTPFDRSQSRWQTWAEFFAEYSALRTEFLAWKPVKQDGDPPYAELEYQRWLTAGRPVEWRGASQCQDCGAPLYSCDCQDWAAVMMAGEDES